MRYNPDGSLDTSFDFDGKVTLDFAGKDDRAFAVAVQANGLIVAAGIATVTLGDFAVACYGDLLPDDTDNCPTTANPDQRDTDADTRGDACDIDDDGDSITDAADNCPRAANSDPLDTDSNGTDNACDTDDDNDGIADSANNSPLVANPDQADFDRDGIGDASDTATGPPVDKEQCRNDDWKRFDTPYQFKNIGECNRSANQANQPAAVTLDTSERRPPISSDWRAPLPAKRRPNALHITRGGDNLSGGLFWL